MPAKLKIPDHLRGLRRAYVVAECQARYRGEPWHLTWDIWRDLWCQQDQYLLRGRGSKNLTLSRIDCYGPWAPHNVVIEAKHCHLARIVEQKQMRKAYPW